MLPKIEDSLVVSLVEVPKYFAISEDKLQYIQEDAIDCIVTTLHSFVCKNLIVRNMGNYPTCVTNIFVQRTDNLCHYKRYLSDFEAHNKIKGGLIIFSSVEQKLNLTCGSFISTKTFNGSVLISSPDQCELRTNKFTYNTNQLTKEVDLGNEAPSITCCSPFYNYVPVGTNTNSRNMKLFDLNTIKNVDTEIINTDLHKLKIIGRNIWPHVVENGSSWKLWTIICITLIIVLYITYKFQHLIVYCCKNKRKPVVNPSIKYKPGNEQEISEPDFRLRF